jgi:hypothetical protein
MKVSPKLQKAGRRFLLRLVADNGPEAAAAILRDLADELEALGRAHRADDPCAALSTSVSAVDAQASRDRLAAELRPRFFRHLI